MNSKEPSAIDKSIDSLPAVDSRSNLSGGEPTSDKNMDRARERFNQWQVLLSEFVHLLALFWALGRSGKGSRTKDALFNQLLRHLHILEKMPDHDGSILVRRIHCRMGVGSATPDYLVLFGGVMLNSKDQISAATAASKNLSHLKSALSRSFDCFASQNIHSLYLRIPGQSAEQVEQFRFSLKILPRYHAAAKEGASIALRYYGRALNIPLIHDYDDRPNPNLTLMAALNGLTAVNAREMLRQARAYDQINASENRDTGPHQPFTSGYDQIFKVKSLRTQLIKPPVEINNLFCPFSECAQILAQPDHPDPNGSQQERVSGPGGGKALTNKAGPGMLSNACMVDERPAIAREQLSSYVNLNDPLISKGVNALYSDDYHGLDPLALGERFVSITRLLYAIDKRCQDPGLIQRILEILQERLKGVSDRVLANIITQRQGLKIITPGRTVMVGLVHPRLFDLITLVKEHVVAYQRIGLIKEISFNVDPCHINSLADGFGITPTDANQIISLLNGCFVANGSFVRPTFESRVNAMTRHENVIFEILWCFLKQTPQKKDRLDFLNAIQLLMARLNDPKRALQFLLADICQNPAGIDYTDRNALALANVLLNKENKELYIDVNRTPEDVLKVQRPLNQKVRQYAGWRLDADQVRYLKKSCTVADQIHNVLMTASGEDPGPFELRFLLALERELIIFSSLVGGIAARTVLRGALASYGNPDSEFYHNELTRQHLSVLMGHLQIVVRALGRAGNHEDIEGLLALEKNAEALVRLDSHPAYALRVKQMAKWIPVTIRSIHAQNNLH